MKRWGLVTLLVVSAGVLMGAEGGTGLSLDAVPGSVSVLLLLELLRAQRSHNDRTNRRLERIEAHLGLSEAT